MKTSEVNKLLSILNKEDIENAMLFIDVNGVPKGRQSNTFDVLSNLGQNYPPPFLLETAYKQKTGEELPRGFFDNIGKDSPHFKIIEALSFSIMEKNQNSESIKKYLEEFSEVADDWFQKQDWFQERYDFYKNFYAKENLEKAEWTDFQDMGNHIHSFNSMAIAKGNALGRMNLPIEEYRRIFLYIISGDDPINITINNLYKKYDGTAYLPYFSDSSTSELIAYAYPEKYVTYNRRDEKALEILGLKLDKVKAEKFGDKFLRYNELLQPVLEQYKSIVGQRTGATPQLELDQFFSWLYETKKSDKPIRDLINRYKTLISTKGLDKEKYKWEFIRDNKSKPNFDNNVFEELKSIKFTNLLYHLSLACLQDIANKFGPELIVEFKALHNESVDLDARIQAYKKNTLKLYRKTNKTKESHYQDERTIAVLLALKNPEEHTLYKSSYYSDYCNYLGIKLAKPNHKYSHYLELVKDLAEDYLSKDVELISLLNKELGVLMEEDTNFLLVAQDMLFQVLGNERETNYWVFQGNPKVYDFKTALEQDLLDNWKVSAHKDKIKPKDQVIIWITGEKSGCYALAEVTSLPKEKIISQDDHLWKEENKSELKVDLKITHNLIEDPILWEDIKELDGFKEFKGGNQGTNFSATEIEYNTIKELIFSNNRASYFNVKEMLDPIKLTDFFEVLRIFIKENNIDPFDNRISFNVIETKKRLAFIIGNRYCISIEKKKNKTQLSFISKDILTNESGDFVNHKGEIEAHWNIVDSYDGLEQVIQNGLQEELNRNNKSPFRKWTNQDFINDVFQIETIMTTKNRESIEALNTILFGPPGTGKTFYLKDQLFEEYTSKETSISKAQYIETVISDCSWWQVIAIALVDLKKAKVSDIFEHDWVKKKAELSNSKTIRPTLWGQLQSHTIHDCEYVNVTNRQQPLLFNKTEDSYWEILEDEVKELVPELYDLKNSVDNYNPDPDKIIKHYDFVTFHQSFAYEDFIEGIKPVLPEVDDDESKDLGYIIEDGVFKNLCKKAEKDPDNKYAIFIDEINRGNVSAIFGELITLIETDKRLGAKNELKIKLPYSKKEFGVPSNLDIYGTMNTADRSVEALDTALRRRFEFKEMMPDYTIIEDEKVEDIKLSKLLETINQRIELLIDRDHTIGHSYFVNVNSKKDLVNAFKNKIVPLLQEYFYGDYGKIGLVLGKGFVKREKNKEIKFSSFKYDGKDEFVTPTFILKPIDTTNIIEAVNQLFETNAN